MRKSICFFVTLLLLATVSFRSGAQSIESYLVAHSYDVCGTYSARVITSHFLPGQTLKFYWGDGTDNVVPVTSWVVDTGNTYTEHAYATSGSYTMKIVLSDGGPIDSVTFSQSVQMCNLLPIGGYVDANANCIFDAGDSWVYDAAPVRVDSSGIPIDTITLYHSTWYRAYGPPGTIFAFTLLSPPPGLFLSCPSTGVIYDTLPPTYGDTVAQKSFVFNCVSTSTSFDLEIAATFWPGLAGAWANYAMIGVTNTSCMPVAATVRFDFSPKYSFGSVYPALSHTVSGTSVTIDVGAINEYSMTYINVALNPVMPLVLGDTVNSTFTVFPISGDSNPANNIVTRTDTVKASCDPNQKSVTPTGDIAAGTLLEYMLEFENTGNDTAHNIHILDTLSGYLDLSTIKGGMSTHKMSMHLYEAGGFNILKFDFPNIMLPDSSHHDVCKGMTTFSVKAKTTLAPGTTIANRVGIYFDVNEVVMTNTVFSKIPLPTGISNMGLSKVELYPNPVGDILNITTAGGYNMLAIYNVMGQQVGKQEISNAATTVSVGALAPGIYYVSLKGEAGTRTIKFEKR